jgi:hypothetical protein
MIYRETISHAIEAVLRSLPREPILERFYLAGGTALALQLGHRRSADLDFFTARPFDEEVLLGEIHHLPEFELISKAPGTIHAQTQGVKITFLGYDYPVLFPFSSWLGADLADPRDIACMKISAIASRGTRRDFVDLYAACRRYGLADLGQLFLRKYGRVSLVHVAKSLTYFEDAEKDPMPNMLTPLEWTEVKDFFLTEMPNLLSV